MNSVNMLADLTVQAMILYFIFQMKSAVDLIKSTSASEHK